MSIVIKLVRHGESLQNVGELDPVKVADHTIGLTKRGEKQAHEAGQKIGADFIQGSLVYRSPFLRACQTLDGLLAGAGVPAGQVRIFEDPRLREVEFGYVDYAPQHDLRKLHGWFYYRFNRGESPADCFDRTSGFLEGLMRQIARKQAKRVLIVTHGLTIRCFVMRFLHLTVEQFDSLGSPQNGAIITLGPKKEMQAPLFVSGKWGVTGLQSRKEGTAEGAALSLAADRSAI